MKKGLLCLIAVLLLVTMVGCSTILSKDDAGGSDNKKTTTTTTTKPEEVINEIGETVELKDYEVTVDSFELKDEISSSIWLFSPKEEENRFLVVTVTIKNNADEEKTPMPMVYYENVNIIPVALYGAGETQKKYQSTMLRAYSDDLHSRKIAAGGTETGILVFDMPAESLEDTETPLFFQASIGNSTVTVKLR